MLKKILKNNIIMTFFFVALGMMVCAYTKFENSWDLTNYHFYNAFSFLNNRYDKDIAVAYVHGFFNPLIELPLYFYIKYFNDYPSVISGLQGIWYGLLLFAFFKFSQMFFPLTNNKNVFACLLTVVIAATGYATYFQAGSSTNEIAISFFNYISLYLLFKQLQEKTVQKGGILFISGIILGMVLGLKATSIYLCLGAGFSIIVCYKQLKRPLLYISLFTIGGTLGYLITNGWWMYRLWTSYQNPFFPFLNTIFESPYYSNTNFSDKRFIPHIKHMLIYPYLWMFTYIKPTETIFTDLRAPVYYTMGIIGSLWFFIKRHKLNITQQERDLWSFYIAIIVLSYTFWMVIFSIHRYLVPIEMMCSIAFVKILSLLNYNSKKFGIIYMSMATILISIFVMNVETGARWKYSHDDNKFIYVENIKLPHNTLIKIYNLSTAAVLPMIAQNNEEDFISVSEIKDVYLGESSNLTSFGKFKEIREEIEKNHKGNKIIIIKAQGDFMREYKEGYFDIDIEVHQDLQTELKGMYCRKLKANLMKELHICVPNELKNEILIDGDNDE